MTRKRSYTAEQWKEIDAARKALTDNAKARLFNPEKCAEMVAHLLTGEACNRLRSYSPLNQALIFGQAEALGVVPTIVAGFHEWKRRGYHPIAGKGFIICAFAGLHEDEDGNEKPRFRWSHIWDITQVTETETGARPDLCAECGVELDEKCATGCTCAQCIPGTPPWQLWNSYSERLTAAGWTFLMPGDTAILNGRQVAADTETRTVHAALTAEPDDGATMAEFAAAVATFGATAKRGKREPVAQIAA